jgi:hypothetical protein
MTKHNRSMDSNEIRLLGQDDEFLFGMGMLMDLWHHRDSHLFPFDVWSALDNDERLSLLYYFLHMR